MTYFCAQAVNVSKKKIEGVKLLGIREFGGYSGGGGGYVKKQNLWRRVRKKNRNSRGVPKS